MKATINGITYEGTYEEITKIVDRMTPQYHYNQNMQYRDGFPADWLVRYPAQPNTRTFTTTGVNEMQLKPMCQCAASCSCYPSAVTI